MGYIENPINPRTGKVWSILDHELADRLNKIKASLRDKESAKEFLMSIGVLNSKGKLAKRYGGS